MRVIFTLPLLLACSGLFSQQQTFDLVTYTPPTGWKKQATEQTVQWMHEDATKGTFCIIMVFKALPSAGSSKENFDAAWETVIKEMLTVKSPPEMQPAATEDGWEVQSGYAPFESEGQSGIALLAASTGYGKLVNILILTNSDVYEKQIADFLESAKINKPASEGTKVADETKTPSPPVKDGYAFSTTNFDNGWISVVKEEWVEVTKANTKVYLIYPLPYNASDFSGTGLVARDYYWDNYITQYFNVQTKQYNDNGEVIGSFKPNYVEGWATDKQTGAKRFIAMHLGISPNAAHLVIAAVNDETSLRQQFPKANDKYSSDLGSMSGYNKFAVDKSDLTGKWSSSGGSTMNWYSTTTGNKVGATGAVKADVFVFSSNGTYTSTHNGATGWVGAMNTYQQNYKGSFTLNNWDLSATKRWDGKTEKFNAWFEVFKGGRVLHLDTPGITYTLFKEK